MQDKILLGFLLDGEKTGYKIKKIMERSTRFFFNTSLGSIYPAFKKLAKEGCVKMRQEVNDGRVKKIYSITDKGRETFQEWLQQDIMVPKIRHEALLKVFFYSNLTEDERKAQIKSYLAQLEEQVEELKLIKEKMQRYNIDQFHMKTLDHGIEFYVFHQKYYQNMLNDLVSCQT